MDVVVLEAGKGWLVQIEKKYFYLPAGLFELKIGDITFVGTSIEIIKSLLPVSELEETLTHALNIFSTIFIEKYSTSIKTVGAEIKAVKTEESTSYLEIKSGIKDDTDEINLEIAGDISYARERKLHPDFFEGH